MHRPGSKAHSEKLLSSQKLPEWFLLRGEHLGHTFFVTDSSVDPIRWCKSLTFGEVKLKPSDCAEMKSLIFKIGYLFWSISKPLKMLT